MVIDFTVHASVRGKQRITVVILCKDPTPTFKQIGLLPASSFHEGINLEESEENVDPFDIIGAVLYNKCNGPGS